MIRWNENQLGCGALTRAADQFSNPVKAMWSLYKVQKLQSTVCDVCWGLREGYRMTHSQSAVKQNLLNAAAS